MNSSKALLVIDVQSRLFELKDPIYNEDIVLTNINSLILKFKESDIPIIYVQHSNKSSLLQNSPGWKLHQKLIYNETDPIIHKTKSNGFIETNLLDTLKDKAITTLIICGLMTNQCVKATALGALENGFEILIVTDAHSTSGAVEFCQKKIIEINKLLLKKGAKMITTSELISGKILE